MATKSTYQIGLTHLRHQSRGDLTVKLSTVEIIQPVDGKPSMPDLPPPPLPPTGIEINSGSIETIILCVRYQIYTVLHQTEDDSISIS